MPSAPGAPLCELAADLASTRTLQAMPSRPLEAAADRSLEGSAALLIARKQGVRQDQLTCEKAEKGREISNSIGAKGSAKMGQKRRELTEAGVKPEEVTQKSRT